MSTRISAANRMREQVLKDRDVVLISRAGFVDEVIKIASIPDHVRKMADQEPKPNKPAVALELNLDNQPHIEAWMELERFIQSYAERDRPISKPLPVSGSPKEEWNLAPEDVPVITLIQKAPARPAAAQEPDLSCDVCKKPFDSKRALNAHRLSHKD